MLDEARDRLRRLASGESFDDVYGCDPARSVEPQADDIEAIIAHDLAMHSPEPITEDWLRGLGFMDGWYGWLYINGDHATVEYLNSERQRALVINDRAAPIEQFATQGALLRLLAALGINPKENHDGR